MANVLNSTNLEQVDGGFLVKQGDVASTFAFSLLDENHMSIPQLESQEASITLTKDQEQIKKKAIVTNGTVAFNLDTILPIGKYRLEISAGGYIFPSDKETHIKIVASDKELVTEEIHALKELDIAEEIKKQLAGRTTGSSEAGQEFPDLLFYYNLGKV